MGLLILELPAPEIHGPHKGMQNHGPEPLYIARKAIEPLFYILLGVQLPSPSTPLVTVACSKVLSPFRVFAMRPMRRLNPSQDLATGLSWLPLGRSAIKGDQAVPGPQKYVKY